MPKRNQESQIFETFKIFLIPVGDLKGKVRREILEKRIIERGGRITSHAQDAEILIASPEVDYNQLKAFSKSEKKITSVQWISECIAKNQLFDHEAFTLHETEREPSFPSPHAKTTEDAPVESNEVLAKIFDKLESMVSSSPDRRDAFRSMAYRTAASAIRKFPRAITSEEDAEELRRVIGPRSVSKVKEFLQTGHVKKAEFLQDDAFVKARTELMGVYGIGPMVATDLVRKGFGSVEKLRNEGQDLLNENQKRGLKFYEELLPKMPRSEVKEIGDIVEKSVYKLFGNDLEMIICGSYRRGAEYCSDADLVFAWRATAEAKLSPSDTLAKIIDDLTHTGFLIDHFNKTNHHTFFLGICRVAQGRQARRLDMRVWPREGLAATILHCTGNHDFNRRMRLIAKRKGYKLNDMGIFDSEGNALQPEDEKGIFDVLGLEYIPPEQRTSAAQFRYIGGTSVLSEPATSETDD